MRTSESGARGVSGHALAHVLWTSGWDSTFRLLAALLIEGLVVQPHYIIDRSRRSLDAELAAMEKIRTAIDRAVPTAREQLLPTVMFERDDIPADEPTTARFDSLAARGPLGAQYEWIARYAVMVDLHDLELSIHHDDRAKVYLEGQVEKIRDEPFASYRLAESARGSDLDLFARFAFPVFDLTKVEMRRVAEQHHFLDVLDLSWFCHRPLGDSPCGICNPCLDAVKEGVGYRLPPVSRARQAVHRVVPWTKVTDRIAARLRSFGKG